MKRPVVITLLIVALVLVCAGIGSVIFFVLNSGFPSNFFEATLVSASTEESKDYSSEGVTLLEVVDDAGHVRITGGDVSQITVLAEKTAWAINETEANKALVNVKYTVKKQGDTLVIKYELSNNQINRKPDTVDFVITVPREMTVTVKNQFGEIELTGTEGDATLESSFGDVTVETLKGGLNVTTQSGRVTAKSINAGTKAVSLKSGFGNLTLEKVTSGDLKVESESGAIELNDVRSSGDMELYTSFGDVTFEKGSSNKLTITTESGKVTLTSIKSSGALSITDKFGNVVLEKVDAASYEIENESGGVDVDGVSSSIKVHSGFGNITIKNGNNASIDLDTESGTVSYEGTLGDGPHKLHSNFGGIDLVIPADSALNIDLKTEFGKIKSDLPITITVSGDVEANHFVGTINDGGSSLTATTQSGDITIEVLSK